MIVYLNVFCSSMKHWISQEVLDINIITPKTCCMRMSNFWLIKQFLYSHHLCSGIGQSFILSLYAWSRNSCLFPSTPRDEVTTKENCKSSCRSSVIRIAGLVCILKGTYKHRIIFPNLEPETNSPFHISQDPFWLLSNEQSLVSEETNTLYSLKKKYLVD